MTDEGSSNLPKLSGNGATCCTSPAPFGGTLPKGEGFLHFVQWFSGVIGLGFISNGADGLAFDAVFGVVAK